MQAEPAPLWLYAPLWGVDFDSDETGLVGGSTLACIPFTDEWQSLQRRAVADERRRIANAVENGAPIPLCLTVPVRRRPEQSINDAVNENKQSLLHEMRRSVQALRLHKSGWFLDPEFAEICFAINEHGWSIIRQPGPYRQSFLAPDSPPPFPRYALKIADLSRAREETGALVLLRNQLSELEYMDGSTPLWIALDYFGRSYGYQSPPADRFSFLFMALESILGGFAGHIPGEVDLSGPGAKLYRRLKAALIKRELDPIACGREAAWVCGSGCGEGRWLRNCVAHGDSVEDADGIAQLRLQSVVRTVLRSALDFFCCWHRESATILATLGTHPDTLPIGAYNLMLARMVDVRNNMPVRTDQISRG